MGRQIFEWKGFEVGKLGDEFLGGFFLGVGEKLGSEFFVLAPCDLKMAIFRQKNRPPPIRLFEQKK